MATVYVSIGNSDDKLTQARWHEFADLFVSIMRAHAVQIFGIWYSRPDAPFQNACVAAEIIDEMPCRMELAHLAHDFDQDSIAWAPVDDYRIEFIGGDRG